MQYKSLKNIHFKSLNKEVMENGVIELDEEFAERVNADLKLTFQDVPKVLVLIGEENVTKEKPKPRISKAELVEEDAE